MWDKWDVYVLYGVSLVRAGVCLVYVRCLHVLYVCSMQYVYGVYVEKCWYVLLYVCCVCEHCVCVGVVYFWIYVHMGYCVMNVW